MHKTIQSATSILKAGSFEFILNTILGVSTVIGTSAKIIRKISIFQIFFSHGKYLVI